MLRRISYFILGVMLGAVICIFWATSAQADTLGAGFEGNSIEGWSVSGTLSATKNTWSSNGAGVALTTGVTNYSPGGGKTWTISPYGSYMASIQPGSNSVTFDTAVANLGLTTTEGTAIKNYLTYQANNGGGGSPTPTNAAWMKKSFTLTAGTTYTMAWQYLSTDYTPWNDGSMITIVNDTSSNILPTLNGLTQRYGLLGFTNPGTGNYATGSYGATGWQSIQFTVPASGNYTIGFSAFNLGDTALSPILFVDVIVGATTLNGATFAPVAPNAGSVAPPAPTPAPAYSSGITATQTTSKNAKTAVRQAQHGNEIYVEQTGSNNTFTLRQGGYSTGKARIELYATGDGNTVNLNQAKNTDGSSPGADSNNHYLYLYLNGNSNSITTKQVDGTVAGIGHFMESTISGNSNNVSNIQSGSGAKILFQSISGSNNTVSTTQSDAGQDYLDLKLTGNGHSVTSLQSGAGNHAATIDLTNAGGASSLNMTQSGSTAQTYSIQQSCTNAAGCSTTITQP